MLAALIPLLLALALVLCLWAVRSESPRKHLSSGAILVAVVAFLAARAGLWSQNRASETAPEVPQKLRQDGFVSAETCQSCHPAQYASWHRSYHRTMTQVVTPDTVLGDFSGVELNDRDRSVRLERRGDEFWANMVDPDWEIAAMKGSVDPAAAATAPRTWNRAILSTGSHYQQTYWVALPASGGLYQLRWSYLLDEKRWIPREDLFLMPPTQDRMPAVWNATCVRCHATAGRPATPHIPGQIASKVADLGISCEACHGPAEEHIRANRNPLRRYRQHLDGERDPTVVNPRKLAHDRSSMICGECHAVSEPILESRGEGELFRPGDDLANTRRLVSHEPGTENSFWPDGTYKSGGREFSGMALSRCYTRGKLACVSCHSMHDSSPDKQMAAAMDGDHACLQCHESYRDRIPAHTHHAAGSEGSRCLNCHMPFTSYALFRGIRNHRIDSPVVDASAPFGRPNACNLCHLDKTLAWTATQLATWYRASEPDLGDDERRVAAGVLWLLRGDASQRAIAAWSAGWAPAQQAAGADWTAPYLAQLLEDPYAAVRRVSYRTLHRFAGYGELAYDPLGPAETRSAGHERALDVWRHQQDARRSRPGRSSGRPELLIAADGSLEEQTLRRLLAARNDRPVGINE